jgi:hypothetical protein
MEIEGTTFGTVTIDGKTYEHDVIIRLGSITGCGWSDESPSRPGASDTPA